MLNDMHHLEYVNITAFKAASDDNDNNVVLIPCGHFSQLLTMHIILALYQGKVEEQCGKKWFLLPSSPGDLCN